MRNPYEFWSFEAVWLLIGTCLLLFPRQAQRLSIRLCEPRGFIGPRTWRQSYVRSRWYLAQIILVGAVMVLTGAVLLWSALALW
jgi:hypothetical protein